LSSEKKKKRPVCEADHPIVSSLRICGATPHFAYTFVQHTEATLTYLLNGDIGWFMNIGGGNVC
jgi:hypothetical protein